MNVTIHFPFDENNAAYKIRILKGENKIPRQNRRFVFLNSQL